MLTFGGMYSNVEGLTPVLPIFFVMLVEPCGSFCFYHHSRCGANVVARSFGLLVLGGCVYRVIPTEKILEVRVVIRGSDMVV